MTRDEAIEKGAAVKLLGKGAPTSYTNKVFANNVVAVLEAIGMLKLDEPKSARESALEILNKYFEGRGLFGYGRSVLSLLDDAGLKIVEK